MHPDFFPVNVMNAVLGGLFNSRINLNLREAHAYTYGAFSAFEWRRQAGPFVVSTAVKSDITDAAAREMLVRDRSHSRGGDRAGRAVARDELSRRRVPDSLRDDGGDRRGALGARVHGCRTTTTIVIASACARSRVEQMLTAAQRYLHPDVVANGGGRRSGSDARTAREARIRTDRSLYDTLGKPIA